MAISHWAPRFTMNGVTAGDFERITSGLERWADWCSAWSAVGAEHEKLGRDALAAGRDLSAGAHLSQASVYYHFAKFLFVDDLDQMRTAHMAAVRCLNDALPYLDPPGRRVEIPFEGSHLVGVLRLPVGTGPQPVMIMIPGLDSAKEELRSTEELFLQRGIAPFSVDGPGQGEAEYDLAIRGDWEVPGAAILDAAGELPGIDANRIGIWGDCLGEIWDQLPELTQAAFTVRSKSASDAEARLRAGELTMAGRAGQITAPLLIVAGQRDRIFPWQDAQRLQSEAGGEAELLLLADGNHGCANVPYRHRNYSADWMASRLGS